MGKTMRAIGLMSGTSMDGIDVALIETDGPDAWRGGRHRPFPMIQDFKEALRGAIAAARSLLDRDSRTSTLADVERNLTAHHASSSYRVLRHRVCHRSCCVHILRVFWRAEA